MQQFAKQVLKTSVKPLIAVSIPLTLYKAHQFYTQEKQKAEKIYQEIQTQNEKSKTLEYQTSSVEKNLRMYLNRNIVETLKEVEVRDGGVDYLNQVIRQKPVIDAILDVLLFCIKDDEFLDEAKGLGK